MSELLDALGHEQTVGVCLDTGNCWLGGSEPLDFMRHFAPRIRHLHWKDMSAEWTPRHGRVFGCGMSALPLGSGVVGIEAIVEALLESGFTGDTTLEIAGPENLRASIDNLNLWAGSLSPRRP